MLKSGSVICKDSVQHDNVGTRMRDSRPSLTRSVCRKSVEKEKYDMRQDFRMRVSQEANRKSRTLFQIA